MYKIAVFTVMLPDLTPEAAVQALAANGYDGVEWRVTTVPEDRRQEKPSFWGNNRCTFAPTLEEARRALSITQAAGLEIPGLGTYINVGDLEATETAMRFAQTCGARQIRVGAGSMEDGFTYAEKFEAAKHFLSGVQELARQYNVRAVVEIHHKTIVCSASLAFRLVSNFDPDWIGVIHDAGNMAQEGFEHYRLGLELLGPYLYHVHIKNAAWRNHHGVWKAEWSPLEDGLVNWQELFQALRSVGYSGWLGLEDFSGFRTTEEALPFNITFLKNIIARYAEST